MKFYIGIVPSIREVHTDQFEYSVDIKLISFLKKNFFKFYIKTLNSHDVIDKNCKLLIISGGNTIKKLEYLKKNLIRSRLDNKFFNQAKQENINILGICHGAQFIANKIGCIIEKKKHLGAHKIFFEKKNYILVNSFHNFVIKNFKNKKVNVIARAEDGSIEYFKYTNTTAIMWHPERNKELTNLDLKIFRKLLK